MYLTYLKAGTCTDIAASYAQVEETLSLGTDTHPRLYRFRDIFPFVWAH